MAYEAWYINPLLQFGTLSLDLVLIDTDGIMPYIRISKNFNSANQITEDVLEADAIMEIDKWTLEYENGRL